MGDFDKRGGLYEATQYVTVAAGATTAAVGGLRSYLESVTTGSCVACLAVGRFSS